MFEVSLKVVNFFNFKRMFLLDIYYVVLDCMIYVMEMCNYIYGCILYVLSVFDILIEILYMIFFYIIIKGLVVIYINIFKYDEN